MVEQVTVAGGAGVSAGLRAVPPGLHPDLHLLLPPHLRRPRRQAAVRPLRRRRRHARHQHHRARPHAQEVSRKIFVNRKNI